jgi:capsular polysaccharide biosynthesis protein
VLLGGLSAGLAMTGAKTYTSTTVMLIDDPLQLASAGSESELLKLTTLRYKYADLAQTTVLAAPVAHDLGLPVSEVLGTVSVDPHAGSLLLRVNATSANPTLARSLSQTMANELTTYVRTEDTTYHIPPTDRYTLTIVDPATPAVGHGPSTKHALTLGVGLAVLGFVIGLVATQLRRNWYLFA